MRAMRHLRFGCVFVRCWFVWIMAMNKGEIVGLISSCVHHGSLAWVKFSERLLKIAYGICYLFSYKCHAFIMSIIRTICFYSSLFKWISMILIIITLKILWLFNLYETLTYRQSITKYEFEHLNKHSYKIKSIECFAKSYKVQFQIWNNTTNFTAFEIVAVGN